MDILEGKYIKEQGYCDKCEKKVDSFFAASDNKQYCFDCFMEACDCDSIFELMSMHVVE